MLDEYHKRKLYSGVQLFMYLQFLYETATIYIYILSKKQKIIETEMKKKNWCVNVNNHKKKKKKKGE